MSKSTKIKQNPLVTIGIYSALIFFLLFTMIPFYVVIAQSITPYDEYSSVMEFIALPMNISFSGFSHLFTCELNMIENWLVFDNVNRIILGYYNMFWQSIPKVIINLFVSGLAGYAYCKMNFAARKVMFSIQISTMMFPLGTLTIPTLIFYETIGWSGSVLPLIIPGLLGGTSTIFFLKQFFEGIPTEIIEAARIDGLGEIGIYFKIMLPLSMPAFMSQFILSFIGAYNSYLGPLLYLGTQSELYPLQLVIQTLTTPWGKTGPFTASVVVFSLIPIIVIYLFGQKFFIGGLTSGAVKG